MEPKTIWDYIPQAEGEPKVRPNPEEGEQARRVPEEGSEWSSGIGEATEAVGEVAGDVIVGILSELG